MPSSGTPPGESGLMEVSAIKRTSAADEALKTLHDMIVSGRLKHGDRLPSQDRLAEQFGVSRNTIREAIYKLTVLGLLTPRQGVGTIVNISSPSGYIASLSDHLIFSPPRCASSWRPGPSSRWPRSAWR